VCGAAGRCAACGAERFGVDPRGTEHVEQRVARIVSRPVVRVDEGAQAAPPGPGKIVVGTAAAVKDFGPRRVGLVAVLDADAARRRPGLGAPEQALATWMEAATWAGPKGAGGRVLVQTVDPGDPAVQALVRWDPWHLHRHEAERRAEAGFPPGHPVFRIRGTAELPALLAELRPVHLLSTTLGDETICLVTLRPDSVSELREWVGRHGPAVSRVEAEPQL
jgi:primosomal protein N' (replication factor Y)